jgi:hypothetical protein
LQAIELRCASFFQHCEALLMSQKAALSFSQLTAQHQTHDHDEFIVEISQFDEFEDIDLEDEAEDDLSDSRVLH